MTPLEQFWKDTVSGKRGTPVHAVFYGFLAALSGVYAILLRIKMRNRQRKKTRVAVKLISVGNITVGGTGKTQIVEMLSGIFVARGLKFGILTQGYKAKKKSGQPLVNEQGNMKMSVEEAGDEAFYLASRFKNVPVLAGRNRADNARLALEKFNPDVLLLDDAFQYVQLHRDLDIVLVDATQPAGNGKLFPAGILREPLAALSRAHIVVLTKANFVTENEREKIKKKWIEPFTRAPVFEMHIHPEKLIDLSAKQEVSKEILLRKHVFVFCGIGNPDAFVETVKQCSPDAVTSCFFPDHHFYSEGELYGIINKARSAGAAAVVTTEKDAVRLASVNNPAVPVYALRARVEIKPDAETFVNAVLQVVAHDQKVC